MSQQTEKHHSRTPAQGKERPRQPGESEGGLEPGSCQRWGNGRACDASFVPQGSRAFSPEQHGGLENMEACLGL